MTSEPLNQYTDICKGAIKDSSAKLGNVFGKLLMEILLLYVAIPRKMNFTQMGRYGSHCEQTYRSNFNRDRSKSIDWMKFNLALSRQYLNLQGLLAIAIDPCFISKSGKKTPHIGKFWSGCAGSIKHGLEIMGLALVDVHANTCMMLRAHQTPSTKELKLRDMNQVKHYMDVISCYKKDLRKVTDVIVADAFFSIRTLVDGIKEHEFHLVSRFRDTADLHYVYTGPRSKKPGRPKMLDGKIGYKELDFTRMEKLHIEGLEGSAYTLIAYSKALKQKVRLVIWIMPNGKHKLFFSTKTSMSGEDVLYIYRSIFQIEFCFRDAKQFTGLTLPGKTQESVGLLLQCIFCFTKCRKGDDEAK